MLMKDIKCPAIMHGRKFESVAIQKFTKKTGLKICESGIVMSKVRPYIGCSPDGLTENGNLVEVKCPVLEIPK